MGLEKKLQDVRLGDLVILYAKGCTVAGYPVDKTSPYLPISFLDPNSAWRAKDVKSNMFHEDGILADGLRSLARTVRNYNLKKFGKYERVMHSKSDQTLEGQDWYQDSAVGDLIWMSNGNVAVSGFITYRNSDVVTLSHISPNSEMDYWQIWDRDYSYGGGKQGDRSFLTQRFHRFCTVRKSADFQPFVEEEEKPESPRLLLYDALHHAYGNSQNLVPALLGRLNITTSTPEEAATQLAAKPGQLGVLLGREYTLSHAPGDSFYADVLKALDLPQELTPEEAVERLFTVQKEA